jgi:serine/threonine-protein kinase
MVDSKDRIKVMDFGLAKLAGSAPITQTGTTLGTMAYMSPEQIQGRPVDHRADLFSFGVLLFEMLTGRRPFGGPYDAALTYAIVNEDPPLLSDFMPNAPQKLSLLVGRLLEKDPAKRYLNSDQLANELKACLEQLPDSLEVSKVTQSTTAQRETGDSSGSGSTSITINFPSLRSRNGLLSLAGIVIVLALVGYWLFQTSGTESTPIKNKIAVLPLESISTEPEDIQFTDGVHEELINRLAGIGDLTVIGRSSVLGFEPGQRDILSIGQQLSVSSLMEGTVRRVGDQLRVSVQLIDVNTLATLWSGSFDDNIDNVFEIQSRVARQVAKELQASLTTDEQERLKERPTDNPQAYRLYMRGREYLSRSVFNENNLLSAEKLLRNAVEKDREFAQAWGMLAYTYSQLYWFYHRGPEHLQKMGEAAEWALFYGPDLAETYLANGVYLYWSSTNQHQTLSHFETALQKFPNQPLLHFMTAVTHRRLGNWQDLIYHLNKALEQDPLYSGFHSELAYDCWFMRSYNKAESYTDRALELFPDLFFAFFMKARIGLSRDGTFENFEIWWDQIRPSDLAIEFPWAWGQYNMLKSDYEEALRGYKNIEKEIQIERIVSYIPRKFFIAVTLDYQGNDSQALVYFEELRKHLELLRDKYPDVTGYRTTLGKVYARLGEYEKAMNEVEKITELIMPYFHDVEFRAAFEEELAEILAWAGQEEQAIDKLEYLLSVPSEIHRNYLRLDPKWDPLRDNPRFQELIAGEDEPYIDGL